PNSFLEACADTHTFCDAIHSRDTHLFQIMRKQTTEAPNYRNTALPPFPLSQTFLKNFGPCPGCNTVCDPIHSRDTHLFRIMKTTTTEAPKHRNTAIPSGPLVVWSLGLFLFAGCTGTRPLKGGRAFTARTPAGGVSQVLLQGENPSQVTKQDQETVRVRTYTLPAGSRIEQPPPGTNLPSTMNYQPSTFISHQPSTF